MSNGWFSLTEVKPSNGQLVLGYNEYSETVEAMYRITWFSGGEETPYVTRKYGNNPITHWKPLPAVPGG